MPNLQVTSRAVRLHRPSHLGATVLHSQCYLVPECPAMFARRRSWHHLVQSAGSTQCTAQVRVQEPLRIAAGTSILEVEIERR